MCGWYVVDNFLLGAGQGLFLGLLGALCPHCRGMMGSGYALSGNP